MSFECINVRVDDSTGLRIHGGTILGVYFLSYLATDQSTSILLNNCSVIELGCGSGAFGLLGTQLGKNLALLTLTDGNSECIELSQLNYSRWTRQFHQVNPSIDSSSSITTNASMNSTYDSMNSTRVNFCRLCWGVSDQTAHVLRSCNGERYDVAIGCELMYYRTDMKDLVDTIMGIVKPQGFVV